VNEGGRVAKLGENGKFYCGGPLVTDCFCCNMECGPLKGCNCEHCMKLDI
jgi:hypothetical protein